MGQWEQLPTELRQVATVSDLEMGQIVFQQGDPAESLYWVRSGRLRLVSFTWAQVITHYMVEAGESFGETALYFDTYSCTAIADRPTQVSAIPKQAFREALRYSPQLSEWYLAQLTQRFHQVKGLLELRSIRSARERVLHYLIQHTGSEQPALILDRPLKAWAGELGITPEGLSRTLAQLETAGVITRRKRSISLHHDRLETVK